MALHGKRKNLTLDGALQTRRSRLKFIARLKMAHLKVGGRQFLTHFNGFLILARNLFAGGFGCKTIVLKGLQNNCRLARS